MSIKHYLMLSLPLVALVLAGCPPKEMPSQVLPTNVRVLHGAGEQYAKNLIGDFVYEKDLTGKKDYNVAGITHTGNCKMYLDIIHETDINFSNTGSFNQDVSVNIGTVFAKYITGDFGAAEAVKWEYVATQMMSGKVKDGFQFNQCCTNSGCGDYWIEAVYFGNFDFTFGQEASTSAIADFLVGGVNYKKTGHYATQAGWIWVQLRSSVKPDQTAFVLLPADELL